MSLRDDLSSKLITFANAQERTADLEERVQNLEFMIGWTIALFREALLSPEALAAAERRISDQRKATLAYPPAFPTPLQVARVAMTAALDAVTGEGDR